MTIGALSSVDQAALNAGCPMFLSQSVLREELILAAWSSSGDWTDSGAGGGSNINNSSFPVSALYDGNPSYVSAPADISSLSVAYLLFNLTTATNLVDYFAMITNFGVSASRVDITFEVDDTNDPTFSSPYALAKFTDCQDLIFQHLIDVNFNQSYETSYDLRYYRLKFEALTLGGSATNFNTIRPTVGQVMFGQRRQLGVFPNNSSQGKLLSEFQSVRAASGLESRYTLVRGMATPDPTFLVTDLGRRGINDRDVIDLWWADTHEGAYPFFYVDHPLAATVPRAVFGLADGNHNPTITGPHDTTITIPIAEQPPYRRTGPLRTPL